MKALILVLNIFLFGSNGFAQIAEPKNVEFNQTLDDLKATGGGDGGGGTHLEIDLQDARTIAINILKRADKSYIDSLGLTDRSKQILMAHVIEMIDKLSLARLKVISVKEGDAALLAPRQDEDTLQKVDALANWKLNLIRIDRDLAGSYSKFKLTALLIHESGHLAKLDYRYETELNEIAAKVSTASKLFLNELSFTSPLSAGAKPIATKFKTFQEGENIFNSAQPGVMWEELENRQWQLAESVTIEGGPSKTTDGFWFSSVVFTIHNIGEVEPKLVRATKLSGRGFLRNGREESINAINKTTWPISLDQGAEFGYKYYRMYPSYPIPTFYSGTYTYNCRILRADVLICAVKLELDKNDARASELNQLDGKVVRYELFSVN